MQIKLLSLNERSCGSVLRRKMGGGGEMNIASPIKTNLCELEIWLIWIRYEISLG